MTHSSTSIPPLAEPQGPAPLIRPAGWLWIGLCTALFAWMHWTFLYATYRYSQDPNWSHVLIVPLISLYYIYLHKGRLAAAPKRICWWALPAVFLGLYSYLFWIFPGRNDMLRGYSMVFTIFAATLFLLGPSAMRVLWFPIAYLGLAVKISDSIWSRIAEKLQDVASTGASWVLECLAAVMNFNVSRSGNTLTLSFFQDGAWVSEPMNVAEACAGLRMLMAFIALGVALAFLFDRAWWQRLTMILLAVPIAVAVNIGRVAALGVITTIDKEYAHGDFHLFVGMLMLLPAAGLFLLLGWVLDQVIVRDEKDDEDEQDAVRAAAAAPESTAVKSGPALVGNGVAWGAAMAATSGVTYAMIINAIAGRPLFEWIGPVASAVVAVVASLGLLALGWRAIRIAPSRSGRAGLTFAVSLFCGVLAVAAAGSQSVISWQKIVVHKEPVPLRQVLTSLPLEKGDYRFVQDQNLPPEIVQELGTEDYLSRTYEDLSVPEGQPGRFVRLHVAYYTDVVDTVPHVPDRCFVVGGAEHQGLHSQTLSLDPEIFRPAEDGSGYTAPAVLGSTNLVHLPQREIDTTRFTFGDPSRPEQTQHVSYFFSANGKFLDSPNAVRFQGFGIRDTHSYYCKIEIMILGENDPQKVEQRTTALLDTFLPEIMACLPDWADVVAGRWPTTPKKP